MIDSPIFPSCRIPRVIFVVLLLGWPVTTIHALASDAASRSSTIENSLKYVGESGVQWMEQLECVSCHQVPAMLWSFEAAKSYGIAIDDDKLNEWKTWSTEVVSFVKPSRKENIDVEAAMEANIDTMVHLLLAIPATEPDAPWRMRFAKKLVEQQQPDGSWNACGQLPVQRRPENETTATTTLWTMLALTRESQAFNSDAANAVVAKIETPVSSEFLAARLLLAFEMGEQDEVNKLRQQLHSHQNDDGGWGWRLSEASDALGTGYALYALAITGTDDEQSQRAANYLIQSQSDNGSWPVPGTKKTAKGQITETATDWGSAWAVIALSAL
ncbi:MAG: prenyltransferase/squalene oxidase repeat-containing protein [Planctomycetota bacterium]